MKEKFDKLDLIKIRNFSIANENKTEENKQNIKAPH